MKYLFMSDIEFLLKKRKKILIALIFIPLLVMLINIKSSFTIVDNLNNCLGTNINIKTSSILEFIMFLFNIAIYLFLIVEFYVKDISYQLDNIFLRISTLKWLFKKNIVFLLITLIIKLLQYFVFILFLIMIKNEMVNIDVFKLIVLDFIYIIFLQYTFIFTYIITLFLNKLRLVPYCLFIVLMFFIPKNIYHLKLSQICCFCLMLAFILCLSFYLFKYHSKKIIENI